LLFNRDREIAELTQGAKRHKQALEEASSINAQRAAQIDQLNSALSSRRSRRSAEAQGETAQQSEVESLRTKAREQATLIDRLQRRLGQGYSLPGQPASPEGDDDRARESLTEAEAALELARNPPSAAETSPADHAREVSTLKARAEDQAGEIARLKAALAAFEQTDDGGRLKNSKLALKARAGSAEAQAERQAATITRLRAELAAANERLARQAAHFVDEMSRIDSGATARTAGRDGRRKLVDRVAQVRPSIATDAAKPTTAATAERQNASRNGNGAGAVHASSQTAAAAAPAERASDNGPANGPVAPPTQEPAPALAVAPVAAAEMPQTAAIPEPRKSRLLDRITGLAKT
jgi:predicted  nucleic acid-binding Zn-ribbon protein